MSRRDPDERDTVRQAAEILAGHVVIWRGLLADHVPNRWGYCAGCASQTGTGRRWDGCALAAIAREAQWVYQRRGPRSDSGCQT